VAQNYGANRKSACSKTVTQGLILAVLAWPFMLALAPVIMRSFSLLGHGPVQIALETEYFKIIILGSIFSLLRAALAGFFSGLGRTRAIMIANAAGLVVNLSLNYVLIFGKFGFPEMRMSGAALSMIIANVVMFCVLLGFYLRPTIAREFKIFKSFRYDPALMKVLVRYGSPCGIEFFLNMAAFTLVVNLFHSYGPDVAAAVTIAFNWDLVAFLPMIGVQVAVLSLVGQGLGAGNPLVAERAAYSGLKVAWTYALIMMFLFLTIPGILVGVFIPQTGVVHSQVAPLAKTLLMLASIYTLADATLLVFSGALRGGGDTLWAMYISVGLHWVMAGLTALFIKWLHTDPVTAWAIFVCSIVVMSVAFFLRFRMGQWKKFRVIPGAPVASMQVEPVPAGDLD
jgi:MATE family multidrug resistance protein